MASDTERGFTLIEAMVVLALAGILTAMAAPGFRQFIASQKVKTSASSLFSLMVQARSEALKRNANVTLKYGYPPNAPSTQSWFIVNPVDTNNPIAVYPWPTGLTSTGPSSLTFLSNGRSSPAVSLKITGTGTTSYSCIAINLTGLPSITTSGC